MAKSYEHRFKTAITQVQKQRRHYLAAINSVERHLTLLVDKVNISQQYDPSTANYFNGKLDCLNRNTVLPRKQQFCCSWTQPAEFGALCSGNPFKMLILLKDLVGSGKLRNPI